MSLLGREILYIKKLRIQRAPSAIPQSAHSTLKLVEDLAADGAWNKVRKGGKDLLPALNEFILEDSSLCLF